MTFKEAAEEIKKCRGNAEAKQIAVRCILYLDNLQKHCTEELLKGSKEE